MRPFFGKLLPGPVAGKPVFEDLSGLRVRRVKRWGKIALSALVAWTLAIAFVIMPKSGPTPEDAITADERADGRSVVSSNLTDATFLIDARSTSIDHLGTAAYTSVSGGRPVCARQELSAGAALAAPDPNAVFPSRFYALLPGSPENAFLSLLRNCGRIDVVLPEWHEILGPDLRIVRADIDAETLGAMASVQLERGEQLEVWQIFKLGMDLAPEVFLAGLEREEVRSALAQEITRAAVAMKAKGACLRLSGVEARKSGQLGAFVETLAREARDAGLRVCLVASLSDQLWAKAEVTSNFDKIIVTAYQEPWIGAYPQPLAPLEWFIEQVKTIQSHVPSDRLVIAVGSHAVDWVSGEAWPRRISLAEAMFRVSQAKAAVDYSPTAKNSLSDFFDRTGNRHQIWMLDAASIYNSVLALRDLGIGELALTSLGEEEPAYWEVMDGDLDPGARSALSEPTFPDSVAYSGDGAFYRFLSAGQSGRRLWRLDASSRFIEDMRYELVPRPVEMERYGNRTSNQIVLTFDDGPDATATSQIMDALAKHDAPATFFVVGKVALSSPELLKRAIDEGHTVGSHSFSHPFMDEISPFLARTELSANRSLIEGVIGRTPLLYRPPYVRGPGPISEREAMVFAIAQEVGYIVAGSDMVPPDWMGASAPEIVQHVLKDLETRGGNVIVLHDGRSTGMHTAEAVDLLIPELRARGYEIVPLPVLLGLTPDEVMPPIAWTASLFKSVSVTAIGLWLALLSILFWICVGASLARSTIYLFLAARRIPVHARTFAGPPSVTVVVPAYNEEKVIIRTLQSILATDYESMSCIVVDDGSTDGTVRSITEAFGGDPRVRILTQENQGKWQALNHAFRVIDTEIAVCVDADTRIAPNAIHEIVRPFTDRKVAAVAGTVSVGNVKGLLTSFQSIEYITAQQIGRRAHEHLNGILVVPGALGAWRVEAVRDVGLYSNETLTEDADLTIWLRRGGYRIAYAEHATSWTEAPANIRSLLKQRLRWSLGNLQTLWKHRRALLEFGPRKVATMFDMVFFGYFLPVLSPILDVLFLLFLTELLSDWYTGRISQGIEVSHLAVLGVAMVQVMDMTVAWIAHKREGVPRLQLLYLIPMMNLLYRPLLYITVYRALWCALSGKLAHWNKLQRMGLPTEQDLAAR